jgi:CRISPR-associated protein Cas2
MTASPVRSLYLIAYDIADHRRLAQVHRFLLGYKVGGQKSFYECWLTPAERQHVMAELAGFIDPDEDRVHVFQLDPRMAPKCFGIARSVQSTTFTIV